MGQVVRLDQIDELAHLHQLETLLAPGAWPQEGFVLGCDCPFGLPRAFVQALVEHGPGPGWRIDLSGCHDDLAQAPADQLIHALHRHCLTRAGFQQLVDAWGERWHPERGKAGKLLHRRTDRARPGLSSTSPLQTRYVPVGKMYFEGMARMVAADLTLPGLRKGRPDALAFEAYPGFLAAEILGRRSYKRDSGAQAAAKPAAPADQQRLIARLDLIDALEQGRTRLGLRLKLTPAQRDLLAADPKGDRLDAALCLMQVAWAHMQHEGGDAHWGLPSDMDPIEGWILTA